MGVNKSNLVSVQLPAGEYVVPPDVTRTLLYTVPTTEMKCGVTGAWFQQSLSRAVSTGQVHLRSDTQCTLVTNYKSALSLRDTWVYNLNGSRDYYQLAEPVVLPANSNFKIAFTIQGTRDAFAGILENTGIEDLWLRLLPSSQNNNLQGFDSVQYFGGTPRATINLRDGMPHRVTIIRLADSLLVQVDDLPTETMRSSGAGAKWVFNRLCNFSNTYLQGYMRDFEVELEGTTTLYLPMTEKEQGSIQQPTIGTTTATLVGYTDGAWERL